ncbi:hypothetical protein [Dethiobacter alkaliphilus]|uniref:Uncharacterized protein n=1 Tax=Dethiobacter alkaliphilus AHT 1 TaxID=555088 RepID=C0GDQ8_DETAL|nr:hypothetical protein [Dethiobacter alkaliphilus]EEG78541.1 hypothetical protein DealDRAFT_0471 [Dethiobacter alkaliphilus AHT 1]
MKTTTETYRLLNSIALLGIVIVLLFVDLSELQGTMLSNLLIVLLGINFMLIRYEKRLKTNQPVNFMSLLKDVYFVISYMVFWLGVALIIYTLIVYT